MMPIEEPDNRVSLLVDIGNTNLKWCWLRSGERSQTYRAPHKGSMESALLDEHWSGSSAASQVLVANVSAPELNENIDRWVFEHWGCQLRVLTSGKRFAGVTNAYSNPAQLGIDRWLALLAAHREYPDNVCVVDCGTAITIDLMKHDGEHLGGLILPGFEMMRTALLDKTHIPRVDADPERIPVLGCDTQTAVASASLFSAVSLVDFVMRHAEEKLGALPRLLLTGSDAKRLRSGMTESSLLDSELIMKGLTIYAEELSG